MAGRNACIVSVHGRVVGPISALAAIRLRTTASLRRVSCEVPRLSRGAGASSAMGGLETGLVAHISLPAHQLMWDKHGT